MTSRKQTMSALGSASQRHLMSMDRRSMLQKAALVSAAFALPGCFAEEVEGGLVRTASMVEGPFYPDKLPLDTDNDLLLINDSLAPGVGEITYLSGRVMGKSGQPIRNAFVEIGNVMQAELICIAGQAIKRKLMLTFRGMDVI